MKNLGFCLFIAGVIWGTIAFNMETFVETKGERIDLGFTSTYIPSQRVHNLELADRRRNHLIGAGITLIAGVIFFGFGSISSETENSNGRKCPFCAESIKSEAVVCRFCGKDLPPPTQPAAVTSATGNNSIINERDSALFEKYAQMTREERKKACFACGGADSTCFACDSREIGLQAYLDSKRTT